MSVEIELLAVVRQQSNAIIGLMQACITLSSHLSLLSTHFEYGIPATDEDKKKWLDLRDEFNKQLQQAIDALAGKKPS